MNLEVSSGVKLCDVWFWKEISGFQRGME